MEGTRVDICIPHDNSQAKSKGVHWYTVSFNKGIEKSFIIDTKKDMHFHRLAITSFLKKGENNCIDKNI